MTLTLSISVVIVQCRSTQNFGGIEMENFCHLASIKKLFSCHVNFVPIGYTLPYAHFMISLRIFTELINEIRRKIFSIFNNGFFNALKWFKRFKIGIKRKCSIVSNVCNSCKIQNL